METINERFAYFVDEIGQNQPNGKGIPEVARKAGIDPNTIRSILRTGGSKPSADTIQSLLSAYPALSAEWLVRGVGPMVRDVKTIGRSEAAFADALDTVNSFPEIRAPLTSPADPAPPQPTAVAEPSEMKELKQDRDKWREMALELLQELRSRPQRQLAATGTDASFLSDNQEAAEPLMWVTPLAA